MMRLRKAFYLMLFTALTVAWATAVVQAQSDTGGYPPPGAPTAEPGEGESYPPPPPPFTLTPQTELPPTPFLPLESDDAPASDDINNDSIIQPWNQEPPRLSDAPLSSGQAEPIGGGGSAAPAQASASSLMSQLFLWVAFSAALLIFIAALFWSIILFNRQAIRER